MNCPFCNSEIADNAKFCPRCGKKIADYKPPEKPRCPKCGAEIADYFESFEKYSIATYCAECGYNFPAIEIKDFCVQPETGDHLDAVQRYIDRLNSFSSAFYNWDHPAISCLHKNLKWLDPVLPEQKKVLDEIPPSFLKPSPHPAESFRPSATSKYYQMSVTINLRYIYNSSGGASLWLCPKPYNEGQPLNGVKVMEWKKFYADFKYNKKSEIIGACEVCAFDIRHMWTSTCTLGAFLLPLTALQPGLHWPVLVFSQLGGGIIAAATNPFPLSFGHGKGNINNRSGNLPAKRGLATNLPITSCRYSFRNGGNAFDITASFANNTAEDSGALKLQLWFCGNDYTGGKINGTAMCESVLSVPSLKSGFFYKDLSLTNLGRIGNPPAGDYRVVLTLSELNEDGNWYIVGWSNFPNPQRWTQPRTKKSGFFTLQE